MTALTLPWTAEQLEAMRIAEATRSLHFFVRLMWPVLEPATPFADGWWPRAWCQHLEAVTAGDVTRIIANCPPGSTKSLLTNVFWPAWVWGPKGQPWTRFLSAAYSQTLTERDNDRMRVLIQSPEYQRRWGSVFRGGDSKINYQNDKTGWKVASSVGGTITGMRGDVFIIDDPNNIAESESKLIRENTNRWLAEVMPTRLNHLERSAIVLIQQRTHEEDATGFLLKPERGGDKWTYVMVPMTYDPDWTCGETTIGWSDPRRERGELFWPARFSLAAVMQLKEEMTDYAWAGQMQQHPEPRGGAIIKRDWWKLYGRPDEDPVAAKLRFPAFDYVVAILDSALTDNSDNDPSGFLVLGTWTVPQTAQQAVMMISAWDEHLQLNPLVKRVAASCDKYHVHALLIENKANGHDVNNELHRLFQRSEWSTQLIDPTPNGAKVARVNSITHLFEEGLVWHPNTEWAQRVIDQCAVFPRGAHDEYPDCLSMGLRHLRERGILYRRQEARWHENDLATLARGQAVPRPLYTA